MKLKIGLISNLHEDLNVFRNWFPEVNITHGKNVIDYCRNIGNQELDILVFIETPQLQAEFSSYYTFLRGKKAFAKVPIVLLCIDPFFSPKVITDPFVRTYSTKIKLFLPLLNLFEAVLKRQLYQKFLGEDMLGNLFKKSLLATIGQDSNIVSRAANREEVEESFIAQVTDEISTNISWVKFNLKILKNGSDELRNMFKKEDEVIEYAERLLDPIMKNFMSELNSPLTENGAVNFPNLDTLPEKEKRSFIEKAHIEPLIFDSSLCTILLVSQRII